MFLIESGLTVLALAVAFVFPAAGWLWFSAVERLMGVVARRRGLSVLIVGLAALAVRAMLLPILPIPVPAVQDEFSYLLAADTFAHGRVTNPQHPMWVHFETFATIQQPTYASKYPPAQGIMLALGQVLMGKPFWGVWLSLGLMAGAICWMLQAWLPAEWAFFGGFLVVMRIATFSYWANSYWGGTVAAIGGALVFGALPRIKEKLRVRDALLFSGGLGILMFSRPYEGLVCALPALVALALWTVRKGHHDFSTILRRAVLPITLSFLVTASAMGYYFWRVTGSPFRMPYLVYQRTYDPAPLFLWQTTKPMPHYTHQVFADLERGRVDQFVGIHSVGGFSSLLLARASVFWFFYLGPVFTLLILLAVLLSPPNFSWRDLGPDARFLLIAAVIALIGLNVEVFSLPHYVAPITCLIYALVLRAMRYVRKANSSARFSGLSAVRGIGLVLLTLFVVRIFSSRVHFPEATSLQLAAWYGGGGAAPQSLNRERLVAETQARPGFHLFVVRYSPSHDWNCDWVYNGADIDGSKIVWARDMGTDKNQELINYFRGRKAWLVEPDENPPKISPYLAISNDASSDGR